MRLKLRSSFPFAVTIIIAGFLAGCGEDMNKKGVAQFEARQFEAAAQTFREILAKDKTNADAIRNLVRTNIELLSDSNISETRALIVSLRTAKREADAAILEKEMEQKARTQALAGAPQFARHLVDLFNAGELAALPVILKSALEKPDGFDQTFKVMRGDKKEALVLDALFSLKENLGAAAALTHIVWRNAPSARSLRANVEAHKRLAHESKDGSLDAAIKTIAELPAATQLEFYRDVYLFAVDNRPVFATAGAYLEANHPAVFLETNIARLSTSSPNAQLLCSWRRTGAVTALLRALEPGKPVGLAQIAEKSRLGLQKSAGGYLQIVRMEAQEKPDRKFASGPVAGCLALFERLAEKVK